METSFKDTGFEWLPPMPFSWSLLRVKDIFKSYDYKRIPLSGQERERMTNPIYDYYGASGVIDKVDDFLFNGTYILIGEDGANLLTRSKPLAFIASGKFWVNNHAHILKPKMGFDLSYYTYLLESLDYAVWVSGSAQPKLTQENLNNVWLYVPETKEQTAIAHYLDTKTQAIDKKVSLLEKKIGYYRELRKSLINETVTKGLDKNVKLKDSGIDWIGQIPKHWEVKRFKDVVSKYTTGGTPSTSNNSYFNGDNIWICIGDITESKYVSTSALMLTDEAIKDANILKTPKGSLLYSFKLSIGKMAFTTVDCYTNEAILSIFPNKSIDLNYYYMMLPIFMLLAATENIYGAKMLNQKLIANAFVVHPPKKEQELIGKYLEDKTSQIDKIIINLQTQITTLKELRKTLINDVVTGKIKVTKDE